MSTKELAFTNDKIELIKRTVAKDTTNDELELFLYQCKRTGLDPLLNQIHCIKRGDKIVIQTAIDGFRVVADRTGLYAGNDDPVFDAEPKPHKASVTVYKMVGGQRCAFTSSARWSEYYPGDGAQGFFWRKMPCGMLGKCAEALALRKAFPQDLSGLYTKEEMDQADRSDGPKSRHYAVKDEDETLPKDKFVEKLKAPHSHIENEVHTRQEPVTDPEVSREDPPDFDDDGAFFLGKIKEVPDPYTKEGADWKLWTIKMEDGRYATTFKENLAVDAKIFCNAGTEGKARIEPNKRKPGKWTYLSFEPIEKPLWPPEEKEEKPF